MANMDVGNSEIRLNLLRYCEVIGTRLKKEEAYELLVRLCPKLMQDNIDMSNNVFFDSKLVLAEFRMLTACIFSLDKEQLKKVCVNISLSIQHTQPKLHKEFEALNVAYRATFYLFNTILVAKKLDFDTLEEQVLTSIDDLNVENASYLREVFVLLEVMDNARKDVEQQWLLAQNTVLGCIPTL